ncbi:MAG: Ig-like domain-containing protein [Gemmatimonadaceae bacterium]
MHKFSRTLLLAGVLAFGTLSAACGDKVEIAGPATGVQLVTVTPSSATLPVGSSIILSGQVTADAASAKTVTWSTSSAAIATVDQAGKVTGVTAGTASITATSTADGTKAASAVITVTAGPVVVVPTISINGVNQGGTVIPVNLANTFGQIDVAVNTSGGGLIEVFLSPNCSSNTIAATDVAVASQTATSAQAGTIILSFNTAQLTAANAPRFVNGNYCIKTRLTNGAQVVVATNTVPLTLNNANTFRGTLTFVSQTGGPITAVSSINGLNYNQGTLTATINPVIFTSTSPVAFITGYLTRSGEQAGGGSPGIAQFTNLPVTAGVATITFADTLLAPAGTSIYQYTSTAAGDNLVVQSATDAAGNPITLTGPLNVTGATGVRIDNDIPLNAGATYTVTAPNGYVGAAYSFASGTGGTAATDMRGGIPGVGGVTTTYYVGATGSAAFTTVNSCTVTGLTVASTGASLDNTQVTTADRVKVIVADALGNKVCQDVTVTTLSGPSATFGVDKIAPLATASTSNNGASDKTGYAVTKNFSFVYNDSGSAGFSPTQPLTGTLTKNFFTAGTSLAGDCLLGTYSVAAKTCSAAPITVTSTFGVPPNAGGSVEFTNGTLVAGYYTITVTPVDQAGNIGPVVTRIAAYDATAPAVATPTQSAPNPVAPLGTANITATATDLFDLATYKGNLVYTTAPAPIQGPAAGSFGATFDAAYVTSGTATVALPNVYRGLQSTTAGVIQANTAVPMATVTVTDVGGNNSPVSPAVTLATTTAAANILTSTAVTFAVAPTSAAPATSQASTTLTVNLSGSALDIPFQSQPFATLEVFKLVSGELVKVATITQTATTYTTTANTTTRFYTYGLAGIPLTAAATNTFYVVGVAASGDAVISPAITVTNP